MSDLRPLEPCPSNEKGIHRFEGWACVDGDIGCLTWLCRYCGALRQVPAFGPIYDAGSKDDLPAQQIAGIVGEWETR